MLGDLLTVGSLTTLVVEAIKWVVRKVMKNPELDFHPLVYAVALPLVAALVPFALFWLGLEVESPVLSMEWLELLKYAISTVLTSVIALFGYNTAIKPYKEYVRAYKG